MHVLSLSRKTLVYGLGQGCGKLLSVVSLPIFTAYLTPDDFGVLSLLALVALGARMLFGLGISSATGIVYLQQPDEAVRGAAIWTAAALLATSAAALAAVATGFGRPLAAAVLGGTEWAGVLALYCLAMAIQLTADPILVWLQYSGRAVSFVMVALLGAVSSVGLSLFLVSAQGMGVLGWTIGFLGGAIVQVVVCLVLVAARLRRRFDAGVAKRLLGAGLPLMPSSLMMYLLLNAAPYLLTLTLGIDAAGLYAVGYQFGLGMALATVAFSAAWYPFFQSYGQRPSEAAEVFPRLSMLYVLVFGFLALLFFVLADPVVALLTEPAFHAAATVIGPLAVAHFLIGLWSMLLPAMYFARETWLVAAVQASGAAVGLAGQWLLAPLLGIEGAGFGIALGAATMVAVQVLLDRWRYRLRTYDIAHLGRGLALLAVAAGLHRLLAGADAWLLGAVAAPALFLAGAWMLLDPSHKAAARALTVPLRRRFI